MDGTPTLTRGPAQGKTGRGEGPTVIDCHIGRRMRVRRVQLGLSQAALGEKIGISFQAVQKYESGLIRIACCRLFELADVLAVPIGYFFEGVGGADEEGEPIEDLLQDRQTRALLMGYARIGDPGLRDSVVDLVRRLGRAGLRPTSG